MNLEESNENNDKYDTEDIEDNNNNNEIEINNEEQGIYITEDKDESDDQACKIKLCIRSRTY